MTPPAQRLSFNRAFPLFALTFVDVLGLTIVLPLLHLYAIQFGASTVEIGLVMAAFPIAQLVGVPLMGALSDRFGRRPLLLISQISTCLGFVLLGTANSLTMVMLARLIDGLFGANLATAQAAISDLTTPETRAQGLGYIGAAFGLGFIIGPVIAFVTLSFTDDLGMPALIGAAYSFVTILITLFAFEETHPPERRAAARARGWLASTGVGLLAQQPVLCLLLAVLFLEQLAFYAFESLLGLLTLGRLGLLGQGNALYFLWVGLILVGVQARGIGMWVKRYGERRVVLAALGLLVFGFALLALLPQQAHPLYVRARVVYELAQDGSPDSATEALLGQINVPLPENESRGFGGIVWLAFALVPIAIGSALVRPAVNSVLTRRVSPERTGAALGLSAAAISAANAAAPLAGGLLVQHLGITPPFWIGAGVMLAALVLAAAAVRLPARQPSAGELSSGG